MSDVSDRSPRPRRGLLAALGRPARVVAGAFALAIVIGTVLLSLPIATETGRGGGFVPAVFTASSAVSVTGLSIVDTASYWSTFGEITILVLMQVGGLGVMTLASMLAVLMSPRLRLRFNLTVQAETSALTLGDVRRVVVGVVQLSLFFEALVAAALTLRLVFGYDRSIGPAAYESVFHSVSAFNNGGFALFSDSLTRYVSDAWICVPIALAVVIGSLGFPVLLELRRELFQPHRWSLHTKLTLGVSGILLVVGPVLITAMEWNNSRTLGTLSIPDRLLAGIFHGVMPRSGGFNTIDIGAMNAESLVVMDGLMFIGGGSASTAGGIKVTTFAILALVIAAEIRGEPDVQALKRRIPTSVQRQALTVALVSVGVIVVATLVLLSLTDLSLDLVLFDTISAFATVGLSSGALAEMPGSAHIILAVLMFAGRLGPITLATALATKERTRRYRLPEERPIVG
ncbi:MAG: TrkH family potassium uptake protein [Actinomycetota bacterium]|nr:TrkH family potassium uptake protein [Actinomycetota bacterium]